MGLSPMMQHWYSIKEKYSDCIIFYRLGDFYEMFNEDAIKASAILELTLTGRDCGLEERAPMCGVPFHAADQYIAKLVEKGEKVAICEQLTLPEESKGLVERGVIKIVSAGTMTDSNLLDEKKNNFIACVFGNGKDYGCAWADITTGDFFATQFTGNGAFDKLMDCLVRVNPAEIISNQSTFIASENFVMVKHSVLPKFSPFRDFAFKQTAAENTLKSQFGVSSLSAYGTDDKPCAVSAAGALVEYLKDTQMHSLKNINKLKVEEDSDYLFLDHNAVRNLELIKSMRDGKVYGTLLWVLDKTKTGMGSRNLSSWLLSPLRDKDKINYRLDGVEELYKNTLIRNGIREILTSVNDIERITGKISNNNITPKDCLALGCSLGVLPNIVFQLSGMSSSIISDICKNMGDYAELSRLLTDAISEDATVTTKEGGYIKEGFDARLDEFRHVKNNVKEALARMEASEKERTGIKNLKIGYNRVFGYYIEVTNSYKSLVPYDYIRKQTLTGAERYVTDELKRLEEKILSGEESALRLEAEIFAGIKEKLTDNIKKLQKTSKSIACLDTLASLAEVARTAGYCRPEIVDGDNRLNLVAGRHPVVEAVSREQFVANDTLLDTEENRTMILTGPNMAGKSTYMRQIALIVIMAHIGSFVPCSSAVVPLTDRIFTRVGASDNLIFDQSTFLVEMTEVASILLHATKHSLLVLDEVGRGTSTYDGLSIAWAVVEYITENIRAKTLFATHYHELIELENHIEGIKNYSVAVIRRGDDIKFLRKIVEGGTDDSYGIEVAKLAGLPSKVLKRAKQLLGEMEAEKLSGEKKKDGDEQISFGAMADDEVISRIRKTNVDEMSGEEALAFLKELSQMLS